MKIAQIWLVVGLFVCVFQEFTSAANCKPFKKVRKLKVRYISNRLIATFRCRKRFTLLGAKRAICIQGNWSSESPVCVNPRCDAIDPIDNGNITESYKGAVLSFACATGYVLQGQRQIYCNGRRWSNKPPTCRYKEPSKQCDFETIDLCGWTQDPNDHFDWKVHSGATPTDKTGPDFDHTFKTLTGHYLYIEASSPRIPDDIARLFSPVYKSIGEGTCFDFYYHMKGSEGEGDVGTLAVYITKPNEVVQDLIPVFNMSGHQSPDWQRGKFEIGLRSSPFRIVISATRGLKYFSDIAIDDVRIYNCSEDEVDLTTQAEPTTELLIETTQAEDQFTLSSMTPQEPTSDHPILTSETYETASVMETTEPQMDSYTTMKVINKTLDILSTEPTVVPTNEVSFSLVNTDTTIETGFTSTEISSTMSLQTSSEPDNVPSSTSLVDATSLPTSPFTPSMISKTDTMIIFTTSSTEYQTSNTGSSSNTAKTAETTNARETSTLDQKTTDFCDISTTERTDTTATTTSVDSNPSSAGPRSTVKSMTETATEQASTKAIPLVTTSTESTTTERTTTRETTVQTTRMKPVKQTTLQSTTKQTTMGQTTDKSSTTISVTTPKIMTSSKDLTTRRMTTILVTSAPTTKYEKTSQESTSKMAYTTRNRSSPRIQETTAVMETTTEKTVQGNVTPVQISTKGPAKVSTITMGEEILQNSTISPSGNVTDIPNIIILGQRSHPGFPVKPLMIGVGVGVAVGLVVVIVVVFIYLKKKRAKTEEFEDEMAPIAKNAYSEW